MTNPIKGETRISLPDGREFTLVMDFEMRVAVEGLCDKPFSEVAQRASEGFHGAIRALLWGSLQRHHADLSMGDVTALIEDHGAELEAGMVKAAKAAAPDASAGGNATNRKSRRATKSSGGNGAKPA